MAESEIDPEKLNKNFTEEERNRIAAAGKLISDFDDMMLFLGKRGPEGRTTTTAIIHAKETFRGQVAERLLKELPDDWRKNLTPNADGLEILASLRRLWMVFLIGVSPAVAADIEDGFNKLEVILRNCSLSIV